MAATIFVSDLATTGFGLENSAYGSLPSGGLSAANKWFGIVKGTMEFPDDEIDWQPQYMHGHGRNPAIFMEGKHECNGSVEFMVQNGKFLFLALGGQIVNTEDYSGAYDKHVIETASLEDLDLTLRAEDSKGYRTLPSFTWHVSLENPGGASYNWGRYALGCKVDSCTITGEEEGAMTASLDIIAKKTVDSNTTLVATSPETTDVYTFAGGTVTYAGSTLAEVTDFEVTINNNLKPKFYWNSTNTKYLTDLLESKREITSKLTVLPKDRTYFTRLISGKGTAAFDIIIKGSRDQDTNEYIQMTLKNCFLKSAPHALSEDDVEMTVPLDIMVEYMITEIVDQNGSDLL
ncbi:MAG: hypothetical protein CMB80_07850 [Flammeovirgaceae bacterium]|nr:hypothetical protein [Flammeovirgaceae bacterium]